MLRDALLIATVDTEVGVWALDADRLSGDDGWQRAPSPTTPDRSLAPFTDPRTVGRSTRRLVLFALTAPDVPDVAVSEALYRAWEITGSA